MQQTAHLFPATQDRVSAAEFVRNIAFWQERALDRAIIITYHGRDRLTLGPAGPARNAEAERSLDVLRSKIAEGLVVMDQDLVFVDANRQAEAFCGLTRDEVLGRSLFEVFPIPAAELIGRRLQRVMSAGEDDHFDGISPLFPGRHIALRAYPHPRGVAVLLRNRTHEVTLEAQVERLSGLATALAAHDDIALVCLDQFGRIAEASPSFDTWLGAAAQATFSDLLTPDARPAFNEAFIAVLEGRQTRTLGVAATTPTGASFVLSLAMAPKVEGFSATGCYIAATKAR